jgi:copper transport protein
VSRNPRSRRAAQAAALLLIIIGVAVARPSGVASAHAELVESVPANGQHLAVAPTTISLRFTESVGVLDDAVRVSSADDGGQIEIGAPKVDGSVVTADVPTLPDGSYVIDWKVVSSDGHQISGAITFAVGEAAMTSVVPATGSGGDSSSETTLLAIWRSLTYAGLALVIGVTVMVVTLWPVGRRHRSVAMLTMTGAGIASIAASARVATEAWVLESSVADLWDLRSGRAWLALVVLGAASLAAPPLLRSSIRRRPLLAGVAVFVAAVGIAIAFAGHGASGRQPVLGAIATILHVTAASVWVGGLAGLAVSIAIAEPGGAGVARRFSTIASACVTTLLVTGIVQSVRELRSPDAITGSDFGVTLLVKLGVVVALLAVATVTRRTVRSEEPDAAAGNQLRRLLGVELGLAVLVLGATGWLAGASPIADDTGGGPIDVTISDVTGEATISVAITPGEPGTNTAHVWFAGSEAAPPDEVDMQVIPVDGRAAPVVVAASVLGDHAMAAPFQIPYAGQWTVKIEVRYGDFVARTFETIVEIG